MKEREYDRIHNEGAEGYNPYRAERERKEWEAEQAAARAHAATPQGRIDALYRRIELECGTVAREFGNEEAICALRKQLHAEIKTIEAEINAAFLTEWTQEVTASRRTAWNATIGRFVVRGRVDMVALRKAEQEQGWTLDNLKKAVALHGK